MNEIQAMMLVATLLGVGGSGHAQEEASGLSPAKSLGMFAYPQKKQNSTQQLKDENACYGSAKQNTGFDPQAAAEAKPATPTEAPSQRTGRSAARGAAGGAAIGAIAGDAGKGAAAGAAAGALHSGAQRRRAQEEAAAQNAKTAAANTESLEKFKRAFSACMDSKGYSLQ